MEAPGRRPLADEPVANRPKLSSVDPGAGTQPVEERTARAHDDEAAEQGDLRPELVGLRRHQERARHRDEEAEHDTADTPGRHRLRVRDHEEQEDQHLGRGDDRSPEVEPADGSERPAGGHAVPGGREEPDTGREGDPEGRGSGEEAEAPGDQQPAHEDDGVGRDHPAVQRRPPEVERLDPRAAEHDEGDDQPDVRRVEQVGAAVADDVLRQEREGGDAGEHVPRVECSSGRPGACSGTRRMSATPLPVSIALAGQTKDRLRRKVSVTSRIARVRIAARICGTLTWKCSPTCPRTWMRDDDGGHVQPRIADLRQDHGVGVRADPQHPAGDRGAESGRRRRDSAPDWSRRRCSRGA